MSSGLEVRPFLAIDLPLVHRLTPLGISLDSLTSLTRGVHTIEGAVWSALPHSDLGTPTFVLRDGDNSYVAQFRHKLGESHAHIVFIAPDFDVCASEDAWLSLLDAMIVAAGRRGALTLSAEVAETTNSFALLRQAGFAVYARQEIWKRDPAPVRPMSPDVLRPCSELDAIGLHSLYTHCVPRMVRQAETAPEVRHNAWVYEHDGRPAAYLTAQEGKCGIYLQGLLQAEVCFGRAREIIGSALNRLPRADKLPTYFVVRRYQDWLGGPLESFGFAPFASQAVMVRHTTRRVEQFAHRAVQAADPYAVLALPSVKEFCVEYSTERSIRQPELTIER